MNLNLEQIREKYKNELNITNKEIDLNECFKYYRKELRNDDSVKYHLKKRNFYQAVEMKICMLLRLILEKEERKKLVNQEKYHIVNGKKYLAQKEEQ